MPQENYAAKQQRIGERPLQSQALRDLVYGAAATETIIATATITVRAVDSMDMTVAGIADGIIAMVTVT
jgi:hypothetical protein